MNVRADVSGTELLVPVSHLHLSVQNASHVSENQALCPLALRVHFLLNP